MSAFRLGLGTLIIAGVVIAHTGFSNQAMVLGMPSNSLLIVWMIVLGVYGWKRQAD